MSLPCFLFSCFHVFAADGKCHRNIFVGVQDIKRQWLRHGHALHHLWQVHFFLQILSESMWTQIQELLCMLPLRLIGVLSILGNGILLFVAYRKKSSLKPAEFFVVNLAISDLSMTMALFPLAIPSAYAHMWVSFHGFSFLTSIHLFCHLNMQWNLFRRKELNKAVRLATEAFHDPVMVLCAFRNISSALNPLNAHWGDEERRSFRRNLGYGHTAVASDLNRIFFAHMWPVSEPYVTVWTAQVALNLTFSNQNQATFKCGTE